MNVCYVMFFFSMKLIRLHFKEIHKWFSVCELLHTNSVWFLPRFAKYTNTVKPFFSMFMNIKTAQLSLRFNLVLKSTLNHFTDHSTSIFINNVRVKVGDLHWFHWTLFIWTTNLQKHVIEQYIYKDNFYYWSTLNH